MGIQLPEALISHFHMRFSLFRSFYRPTVCVTRWWTGVDNAHYTEKCLGVESASLIAANPTSRVHALLGCL